MTTTNSPLDGRYPIPEATPAENALVNEIAGAFRKAGPPCDCPACGADMLMAQTVLQPLPGGGGTYPCPECGVTIHEGPDFVLSLG